MPKPTLTPQYQDLCDEIIKTFLAGHHQWRPDLGYPESHSDMMGGAHALIRMFEIKRRLVEIELPTLASETSDYDYLVADNAETPHVALTKDGRKIITLPMSPENEDLITQLADKLRAQH